MGKALAATANNVNTAPMAKRANRLEIFTATVLIAHLLIDLPRARER
jgi:hypothetical protein